MGKITFTLPPGSRQTSYVHPEMDVRELNQDLLAVRLPTGIVIEAGWFPENDPSGHFVVRRYWGTRELGCAAVATVNDLREIVEDWGWRYGESLTVMASNSASGGTLTVTLN